MTSHSNTPGSPTKKTKKCRFCPIWHRFQPNGWGTAVFKMRRHFINLSSTPDAELKTHVGILNFLYGLRYRDVSADLSRHNQKHRSVLGGGFGKEGAKYCPLNFLVPLVDSKLNVDYDFAIKHDPIQSDDWVMDFCVMPESRWAPKTMSMS